MNKATRFSRMAIVGVLLLALVAAGFMLLRSGRGSSTPVASSAASAPPSAKAAAVLEFVDKDILTLAPVELAQRIPVTGTLRPGNQTVIRSKVAGEIKELLVKEGVTVRAGQVLARIDPLEFEWRVKERDAQLRAAQAQLEQAKRTFENNRQLLEKNFISQSAFESARFSLDSATGNRDAAVAQLTMARKSLADSVLTAPIAGVIGERFAQAGEKVSPDNRIVSIVDLSRMEIDVPVPASDIGAVRVGQTVTLNVEGIETPQVGTVIRISPGTQAGTRSVPVYLGLENKDARLRAGLFAQGLLVIGNRAGVIAVPETAIRDAGGRTFVYLLDNDRLVERDVLTGVRDETAPTREGMGVLVEIRRGLAAGDRIVGLNLGTLRAGSQARVAASAR